MKNTTIIILCILITSAIIANAYHQKKQFYPTIVYITRSKLGMAFICLQTFLITIIFIKLLNKMFFGELRPAEFERLIERSWYVITETGLAFTVFRDDLNLKFLTLFLLLLFIKSFHWLTNERVDFMERSAIFAKIFHIRIVSLLLLLGIIDVIFLFIAFEYTVLYGPSAQLVFGFEYAILFTFIQSVMIKYAFHLSDYCYLPWENKAVYMLYTKLIIAFIQLIIYITFFILMVQMYTVPLFAFRPMYFTMRSFKKAVSDVIYSRRAIRNLNLYYPDVSVELNATSIVCIICREEMRSSAKKLPCNHIFHTSCLRSWFQRQQTCPTCRLNVLQAHQLATRRDVQNNNTNAGITRNNNLRQNRTATRISNAAGGSSNQQAEMIFKKNIYVQTDISGDLANFSNILASKYIKLLEERNKIFVPSIPCLTFNLPPPITINDNLTIDHYQSIMNDFKVKIDYLKSIQETIGSSAILLQQYLDVFCICTDAVITNMENNSHLFEKYLPKEEWSNILNYHRQEIKNVQTINESKSQNINSIDEDKDKLQNEFKNTSNSTNIDLEILRKLRLQKFSNN